MNQAKQQLRKLFINRKPLDISIELNGFTGFRTGKIEELTDDEAEKLLAIHLKTHEQQKSINALKEEILIKEYRSKILAIATREGIHYPNNWKNFNYFMLASSRFKKPLNEHNLEELRELLKQMNALAYNNTLSAQHPMTKAWQRKAESLKQWN